MHHTVAQQFYQRTITRQDGHQTINNVSTSSND